MSNGVGFAMVGFLINNEPLGSGGDKGKIVDCLHWCDFDREDGICGRSRSMHILK